MPCVSYGLTSSAPSSSEAAEPANRERTRTPGSAASWQATYSMATKFALDTLEREGESLVYTVNRKMPRNLFGRMRNKLSATRS
jgi:hypothetical protein